MTQITYTIDRYLDNVIYDFKVIGDIDNQELVELTKDYFTTPKQSYMPQIVHMPHLVTECDPSNKYNPSRADVKSNRKVVAALVALGAVEVAK
jgi:predicted Zn-dependent peptidase